ncbi:MAG: metal-dependent hydrolase [Candidatus Thorarchaeota archaeon]
MTTGGLHILSGLIIASFIRNEKYKKAKWGLVWGSIFPDIDLIATAIMFLITGDLEGSIYIHRTVTHGFFAMGLVLLIGVIISRTREDLRWISMFSIAFAFGMLTHTFYDLLDGYVSILAPFIWTKYSITGSILGYQTNTIYITAFNDTGYKAWNAFDVMSDALIYLLLWYWATHKANIPKEQKFSKILLIVALIGIAYFGVLFGLAFTDISVDMHLVLIYIVWILLFLPFTTVLIHIKLRKTIQDFSFLEFRKT